MLTCIFQKTVSNTSEISPTGYSNPGAAWWREALPRIPTTLPEDLQAYLRDMHNYLQKGASHMNGVYFLSTPSDLTKDYQLVWNSTNKRFEWSQVIL